MTMPVPPGSKPAQFPVLGFDPAPGEPALIEESGTKLARVAGDLAELRDELKKVGAVDSIWAGKAASAFTRVAEPLPQQADEVQ